MSKELKSVDSLVRVTREVVSEKYPPTAEAHIVSTFQHRNGDRVIYRRGRIPAAHDALLEVGWCYHCADEVWTENAEGKFLSGHAPARFARFEEFQWMDKCPSCAEKFARWKALQDQVRLLQRQMQEIEAEVKSLDDLAAEGD